MGAKLWKGKTLVLHRQYDFAVDGGAVGAIQLGKDLPDDFIVQKCVVEVITPIVGAGATATLGEDGGGDVDGYNTDLVGASAGVTYADGALVGAVPHKVAAANDGLILDVLTAPLTAGKVNVYLHGHQSKA